MENTTQLNIICFETEAFYKLLEELAIRISDNQQIQDAWIDDKEAMRLLRIKSKTTLQSLRDQGKIRYSQMTKKLILYDRESILAFIESKVRERF